MATGTSMVGLFLQQVMEEERSSEETVDNISTHSSRSVRLQGVAEFIVAAVKSIRCNKEVPVGKSPTAKLVTTDCR